jgi:PEP-CTERM motif-containing protein
MSPRTSSNFGDAEQSRTQPDSAAISPQTYRRLKRYAAAAGLGAFSFAQTAEAGIVYTDIPDVNVNQGNTIYINLDGSGQNEFAIVGAANQIRFNPYNIGGQQSRTLTSTGSYYVFSFNAGASIGPLANSAGGARLVLDPANNKYIGMKWDIGGGNFRFGWARIDLLTLSTAKLYDFAYESTPNTAILAGATGATVPEPSSLALVAAGGGAMALAQLRRRKNRAK